MGRFGGLRARCLLAAVSLSAASETVFVSEIRSAGPFRLGGGGGGGVRISPPAALIVVLSGVLCSLANPPVVRPVVRKRSRSALAALSRSA